MVDSFLAGSSLRGIAKGLNAQGVKPPRLVFYEEAIAKGYRAKRPSATPWSYVAVRGILTAPALAALISHGGEPCRDEHGLPIFAGVGIVDLDERSQILEELRRRAMSGGAPRATRGDARRDTQPKYLLTGFGRCGNAARRSSASRRFAAASTTDVPARATGRRVVEPSSRAGSSSQRWCGRFSTGPTRPHSLRRVSMGPDQRVGGPLTGSASRAARRCHSGGLGLRGRCPARSPRAHRLDR